MHVHVLSACVPTEKGNNCSEKQSLLVPHDMEQVFQYLSNHGYRHLRNSPCFFCQLENRLKCIVVFVTLTVLHSVQDKKTNKMELSAFRVSFASSRNLMSVLFHLKV